MNNYLAGFLEDVDPDTAVEGDVRAAFTEWLEARAGELDNTHLRAALSMRAVLDLDAPLLAALYESGWSRLGWARELGGLGGPLELRAIFYDCLTAANLAVPEIFGKLEVLLPAIARVDLDSARAVLAEALAGTLMLCQGFSEPDAGSDVAAIRTRAVRQGDEWIINGQKTWTSHGTVAQKCILLVRTGTQDSRHKGLTLIWVDMASNGVTVRPIDSTTGRDEFAEVFYEDVRVPLSATIGVENGAWPLIMTMFEYERAMWAWQRQGELHRVIGELSGLIESGTDADRRLGDAASFVAALRARTWESVTTLSGGGPLGPGASIDKSLLGQAEQLVLELATDFYPAMLLSRTPDESAWIGEWFYTRAASVYGGAREVQRNVIAERVLGLPR